ncbi:DNA polymerase III subunit epsilon [Gluconacetobacter tumulisoli]|uniref:DNA polymerase III subunit epsilon n=1 Tax=Gluconacetobacter tumulisoli TaxID=1286189 RepID=A0A7W4K6I4_9PROT|nr:DNA polymerase III subunit epsilon [Gluconacetobacter tumulisoli]MBB2201182.1 DNA polymerase III subunit epsilon [Gluconacetobacter tumulisoli]
MSALFPDAGGPEEPVVRVVDLETSGRDVSDGGIVEIGWQDLRRAADGTWALSGPPLARLTHPGGPITPATSAIHHIADDDVRDAPPFTAVAPAVLQPLTSPVAFAAHRAAFEQRWIRGSLPAAMTAGLRWICTYKCALRLWPDEPGHSNQGLRYSRRPVGLNRDLGHPAHRAGPDAYVTAHHLRDMLALVPLETLLRWSREPALLAKVPHGPLRGRRIRHLDQRELERIMLDDRKHSPDLAFTVRTEQARRRGAAEAGAVDRPVQPCLPL